MFGKMYYNKGNKLHDSGDYVNAIEKFNQALNSGELNTDEMYLAYARLGQCFYQIGNFADAINMFECAIKCHNDDYRAYSEIAIVYLYMGEYAQSLQYIDKAIEYDSTNAELWFNKGTILCELKRYDDAEKALDTALGYTLPSDHEAIDLIKTSRCKVYLNKQSDIATELRENGKYEDAIAVYDTILESIDSNSLSRDNEELYQIRANSMLKKERCLISLEKYDSALEVLNGLSDLAPYNKNICMDFANCYAELNKFDDASKYWAEAEKLAENEHEKTEIICLKYTKFFYKVIEKRDHQAELDYAKTIPEDNIALKCAKEFFIGRTHFYLGNYDEALKTLLPYIESDWLDSVARGYLGRGWAYTYVGGVYYKQKHYETALNYLNKCVEIDYNELTDTWLFMGECFIALKKYEKAIEALKKAVEAWYKTDAYDITHIESRIKFAEEKLKEQINLGGECNFCPSCGSKVDTEDSFCGKCGRRLK